MPTKLRKLKITRVAVCEQGANYDPVSGLGAHILLFKSADASLAKGPVSEMGMHAEPDGDEQPPLDYRTRGQQYDLWEQLWAKWQCFTTTFYDCIGDGDEDNVPHLPILVDSIGQFQEDVQDLLVECGVAKQVAPLLMDLHTLGQEVSKAGAAMAGHRLTRFKDALAQLQQILAECTPEDCPHGVQPPVDRAGVSAADVTGIPFVMKTTTGANTMAVTKNAESDKEHCDNCDSKDCDNPAHDRMKKEETRMAEHASEVATLKAELDSTRAQLDTATAALAKAQADLEILQEEQRIAKMSPEEQRDTLLASMPELVRKSYLDQEARLAVIEKTNNDLREKNERLDYIAKTVEFRDLGFVPDDHWMIFKAIDQIADETARTELLRLLKSAKELAKTSPWMTTVGSHHPSAGDSGASAEQQLMALAQQHAEEKGVPLDKAVEAVIKAHPDLYQRNMLEKRRTNQVSYGTR